MSFWKEPPQFLHFSLAKGCTTAWRVSGTRVPPNSFGRRSIWWYTSPEVWHISNCPWSRWSYSPYSNSLSFCSWPRLLYNWLLIRHGYGERPPLRRLLCLTYFGWLPPSRFEARSEWDSQFEHYCPHCHMGTSTCHHPPRFNHSPKAYSCRDRLRQGVLDRWCRRYCCKYCSFIDQSHPWETTGGR